jgi:hypothetical protein
MELVSKTCQDWFLNEILVHLIIKKQENIGSQILHSKKYLKKTFFHFIFIIIILIIIFFSFRKHGLIYVLTSTRCQFHQHSRYSFCACRSRKRKKYSYFISVFLRFWDLWALKLYVERWWNWAQICTESFLAMFEDNPDVKDKFYEFRDYTVEDLKKPEHQMGKLDRFIGVIFFVVTFKLR